MLTATIGCGSSGDNTLIAATSGKSIHIRHLFLIASESVDVYLKDSDGNELLGKSAFPASLVTSGGFVLPPSDRWWTKGAVGAGIVLNLSGAVTVAGVIGYDLYPVG